MEQMRVCLFHAQQSQVLNIKIFNGEIKALFYFFVGHQANLDV